MARRPKKWQYREYRQRDHPPPGYRWREVAEDGMWPLMYDTQIVWRAMFGHLHYQIYRGAPWIPCASGNGIPVIPTAARVRMWHDLLSHPFERVNMLSEREPPSRE